MVLINAINTVLNLSNPLRSLLTTLRGLPELSNSCHNISTASTPSQHLLKPLNTFQNLSKPYETVQSLSVPSTTLQNLSSPAHHMFSRCLKPVNTLNNPLRPFRSFQHCSNPFKIFQNPSTVLINWLDALLEYWSWVAIGASHLYVLGGPRRYLNHSNTIFLHVFAFTAPLPVFRDCGGSVISICLDGVRTLTPFVFAWFCLHSHLLSMTLRICLWCFPRLRIGCYLCCRRCPCCLGTLRLRLPAFRDCGLCLRLIAAPSPSWHGLCLHLRRHGMLIA